MNKTHHPDHGRMKLHAKHVLQEIPSLRRQIRKLKKVLKGETAKKGELDQATQASLSSLKEQIRQLDVALKLYLQLHHNHREKGLHD